ncbi:MAG: fumarylacetoacetate hydrolase family protein [Steroidobacteraceae bacterium]
MKLLRYGPAGEEQPGLIDSEGRIRSLAGRVPEIGPAVLSREGLRSIAALDSASLPIVEGSPRIALPIAGTRKLVAIGLNYADHAAETGSPIPQEPVVFLKAITCLNGPYDDVILPRDSRKTDWEVELGVVIGTRARCVDEARALEHVAGYAIVNDVSEREFQLERGGTWDKGKGCDTFGPVGPWLVTREEVPDVQNLGMWLEVNGRRMQSGNTRTMIFSVAQLVSYVSRFMTLEPADIITTGTPPGVGAAKKPQPIFLKPGDTMRLGIDGLGEQSQRIVAWPGARAE